MISADALVREARALCGVKWLHQGRNRHGVDCIGLVDVAARQAGLDIAALLGISAPRNYGRKADPELYAMVNQYCVQITQPVAGALVLITFPMEKNPRHFGLYTAEGNLIHANAKEGRVCEHGFRGPWLRLRHTFWQLPGVDYA